MGGGWTRQSGGQFGEFQVRNYLQLRVRSTTASDAAKGWQGDRYDVYVNGADSVAAFRLRFANDGDAQEFVDAQQSLLEAAGGKAEPSGGASFYSTTDGNATAIGPRNGSEVVFVIGSSRDIAAKAIGALLNG